MVDSVKKIVVERLPVAREKMLTIDYVLYAILFIFSYNSRSPIYSAFSKIMDVMQRVPPHDWEENFEQGAMSSTVEESPNADDEDGASPQIPSSSIHASATKANYPTRARYPRKRFSLDDATFKPWRSPSPRKQPTDGQIGKETE